MLLAKFFAVFVVLIGRICLSKIIIDSNNREEFAVLETAAIRILENCYANRDKAIVLVGDFPGSFIKKLSMHEKFSTVLLDGRRRAENSVKYWTVQTDGHGGKGVKPMHKVHVLVTIAPLVNRFTQCVQAFMDSRYYTTMTYVLILSWSPKGKNAGCNEDRRTFDFLYNADANNLLYVNMICRHRTERIIVYGVNGFKNYAPKPWQLVRSMKRVREKNVIAYFAREYRDDDGMCENLFFDKTDDLNGTPIKIIMECTTSQTCSGKLKKSSAKDRLTRIQNEKRLSFIREFIANVNGTQLPIWENAIVGKPYLIKSCCFRVMPTQMKGVPWQVTFSYPHEMECKFLITQYRGNKTQLKKIYDTIDSYSWVGMWIVYIITLIFFKYFMHQTLIEGLVNICRLTCNFGLTTTPRNLASRIYIGCLLFFAVTMIGIFSGNLASVLTHDTPVRQVNSIRDLVDLNYTLRVDKFDFKLIKDAGFKGRIIERLTFEDCVQHIKREPLTACLTWGAKQKNTAINSKLYISSGCIASDYIVTVLPDNWPLEGKINKFLLTKIGGGFMADLDVIVDEMRLLEDEAEEVVLEPEIMTLADLGFAFAIFGVGFACAFISFIVEIMIYRFQHRVTTTRVIVLK